MSEIDDVIKQVRDLEIKSKGLVNSLLPGVYNSKIRGRGLDFYQLREYVFGDDIRNIDWNVTARLDAPHVREFMEEKELEVFTIIDFSPSMFFGKSKSKRNFVLEIVASILFSCVENSDKIGAGIFTKKKELFIPAKKGKKHVFKILQELINFRPHNFGTDITEELRFLKKVLKQRSLVFIISDFIDLEIVDDFKELSNKHDVILVKISDPLERQIPKLGYTMMEDLETGEQMLINTGNNYFRNNFEILQKEKSIEFTKKIKKFGLDLIEIQDYENYQYALREFFNKR